MTYRIMHPFALAHKALSVDSIVMPNGEINPGWTCNPKYDMTFESLASAQEARGRVKTNYNLVIVDDSGNMVS